MDKEFYAEIQAKSKGLWAKLKAFWVVFVRIGE